MRIRFTGVSTPGSVNSLLFTPSMIDATQSITLWHHQDDSMTDIPSALIRRYRHRRYSQVVDSPVPVNYAHWYFSAMIQPLPGDEVQESDGTVWTILEANLSPLTGVWQTVCETFAFALPTESVDHLRRGAVLTAALPVRVGTLMTTLEPEVSGRLTFYVRDPIAVEADDMFRRSDGSLWKIVRVEHPLYRTRWTVVHTQGAAIQESL